MKRREFITLLGGAVAAWPPAAHAQQPDRVRLIGIMSANVENDTEGQARHAAFRQGLQQSGWTEGRNIRTQYRWADNDLNLMRTYAKELVELQPDVIIGHTTPVVAALLRETRTIPIIFTTVADPVGSGFVASLAHPGGNATGFINLEASLGGKWLELLKEITPHVTRVAFIFNPQTAPGAGSYFLRAFEAAAASFAVQPIMTPVHDSAEIEAAITALAREHSAGLVVMPDIFTSTNRSRIISLTALHRLPAIYPFRYMALDGGLISYGVDLVDLHRRAASYVDRILRGAQPAELPVQLPTKFELTINLKTAKTLGLDVPATLLARADEVVE
jgi:putative ABC transport system substrate-binding protein